MSTIRAIYLRDLKAMFSFRFTIVTILALVVLPSLYTLINVRALWNPYDTTEIKNIPVAVVNQDQGATLQGKQLAVGDQMISTLKKDKQLDWQFTSAKTASERLKSGKYYAEIIIPKDFSKHLASITSDNPKKAKIIYKSNARDSPMGGKITETAANTLVNQVQQTFLKQVNREIFSVLNLVGNKAGSQQAEILALKDWIVTLGDSMNLATNVLGDVSSASTNMATVLTGLKPVISASQNIDVLQQSNAAMITSLSSVQGTVNKAFSSLNTNLKAADASGKQLNSLVSQLNRTTSSTTKGQVNSQINRAIQQVDLLKNQLTPLETFLKSLNQQAHLSAITSLTTTLSGTKQLLTTEKSQLNQLKRTVTAAGNTSAADRASALRTARQINGNLTSALTQYNTNVQGHLSGISSSLISATQKSQSILKQLKDAKGIDEDYLDNAIQSNKLIASTSGDLETKLLAYQSDVKKMSDQLKLTDDNDIVSIITVLQNNPNMMGNTLVKLFNVKDESIYRVKTFGEAFLPSYVTISIWVGCTMLIMVLHTTIPRDERRFRNATPHQEYLGKMLTFGTLSLVQTAIIIFSSVLLLHAHVENFFVMLVFGVLTSLTFTSIVYTSASLFGNLGKAFAVILVAMQLAGSGAMYPVQLNPWIFRVFQPLFPFTYAIGGFREAVGGPNPETVFIDMFILSLMTGGMILLGYLLKNPMEKHTQRLLSDFRKTGIGQ